MHCAPALPGDASPRDLHREQLFLEERRRLEIIPNAFGAQAALKLMCVHSCAPLNGGVRL
jgi:hypothetical protein